MTRFTATRRLALVPAVAAMMLTGCAAGPADAPAAEAPTTPPASDHGAHAGAAELGEPQTSILSISTDGEATVLDLLTEEETAVGSAHAPSAIASDGRYGFLTTADGVDIVDGGAWSWDHGDHFHFYRGEPAVAGSVPGEGPVVVATPPLSTRGATGLFFSDGVAVAIDMAALDDGELTEWFRIDTGAESGVVAPAGNHAIVAAAGTATVYDDTGEETGETVDCADPSGAIATRVGTVIGCADGALLATADAGPVELERIPYPDDAPRAAAFGGREGRPTVAALSGENAFWLLDTRSRSWSRTEVDASLIDVVAADDNDGNVVAIDAEGRVRVFGADGTDRGSTEPIADEDSTLVVDTQRAYVSVPSAGTVYEIDYADNARIARELVPEAGLAVSTVVGR
ncbi:hypothetical protein [Microbacterium gubbeenense]|uniref:hypothetical protein n=1 Tax=Microbacterium gubbeenense TaxID=159896 RepID=UPI00041FD844|nr:hypothetical protein [Microbacterium gubbeenense]